jgi:DNA-binding transcriptional MerR regulator
MSVLVPIGDFSRMTHLSVKALRFYHDQGLLEPARIDPATGYRFYDPRQVPVAQVIRRFRDLDMPLDQVKAVLRAPDVETRTKEIIAHLTAMESKLAEMQMSVASLRALLEGPPVRPIVEFRSIPAAPVLAVRGTVSVEAAGSGRVESLTIPAVEAAVMVHSGPAGDTDQTYGMLGTVVAERAIGVKGPIREYYLVPLSEPDPARHRIEICWPVFQTA